MIRNDDLTIALVLVPLDLMLMTYLVRVTIAVTII